MAWAHDATACMEGKALTSAWCSGGGKREVPQGTWPLLLRPTGCLASSHLEMGQPCSKLSSWFLLHAVDFILGSSCSFPCLAYCFPVYLYSEGQILESLALTVTVFHFAWIRTVRALQDLAPFFQCKSQTLIFWLWLTQLYKLSLSSFLFSFLLQMETLLVCELLLIFENAFNNTRNRVLIS